MKKIYLLLALFICHYVASAQTLTVNATGLSGSYKTGYTKATSGRTDGNMLVGTTGAPARGYAVFNLGGLPGGATVMTATLRFNFITADTAAATVDSCSIFGYAGDLSTVTTSSALYADCASGAAFNRNNWGADTAAAGATDYLPLLDTGLTFLQLNHGNTISIGFSTFSGPNSYSIIGEGGSATTQPQLAITYSCTGVYSVSASATPNPVCIGDNISLTGTSTGTTSYLWSGPGGFTSSLKNLTISATYATVGVYTFTATNSGGCPTTVTTAAVAVNSLSPTPINGVLHECVNTGTSLTDAVSGGVWTSTIPPVATISYTTGLVIGVSAGTTIITYNTGCGNVTAIDTVYPNPTIFAGTGDSVCIGDTTSFAYLPAGGSWTTSNTAIATVLPGSGLIAGIATGTANVTYTIAHGCYARATTQVNPSPPSINGVMFACPGTSVTLTDAVTGGTWSSDQSYIASTSGTSGKVTGVSAGTATIVYTDGSQCSTMAVVTINPLPLPIVGGATGCGGTIDTLYDATSDGVWSSSDAATAVVTTVLFDTSAAVTTLAGGTATISYTLPTGCAATKSFKVNALPVPVVTYNGGTNTFYTENFYIDYQWYDQVQGLIAGADAWQTAALYVGYYWVKVTDTNGCAGTSAYVDYTSSEAAGIPIQANAGIHIYPNPASETVYIESGVNVRAVLSDIDGKTVVEQGNAKRLDISNLASGVYFISLYADGGQRIMVEKIVKQ